MFKRRPLRLLSGELEIALFAGVLSASACATSSSSGATAARPSSTDAPSVMPPLPRGWSPSTSMTREGMAQGLQMTEGTSIGDDLRAKYARLVMFRVVRDGAGKWAVTDREVATDGAVEQIWLDPKERSFGAFADDPVPCRSAQPDQRANAGYTACTSNLASSGVNGRWRIDPAKLAVAALDADLFGKTEAAYVEAQGQHRRDAEVAEHARQEREDTAQRERQVARDLQKAARAARDKRAESLRAKLQAGTDTHCGMVIETKGPIVKVQTMVGERWFRREQIFSPGDAPCRFMNGVYEEP